MPLRARWTRRAGALVLTAGLLLPGSATATPRTSAGKAPDLVTFGLGPSDGRKVDGRPYFYYAAAPGAVIQDHVVVLNYSAHALRLSVYSTDGYNSPDGTDALLPAGQAPHDLGAWTQVERTQQPLVVPGRAGALGAPGSLVVPFRVAVPGTATPGDHVAGLVASLRTYVTNSQGLQVPLDQRVATQVFLRVAGPLHPELRVEHLTTEYVDNWNPFGTGKVKVSYTVRNVGNVRLGAAQRVTASGLIGSWRSPRLPDLPLLVPGGEAHVSTVIRGVWPEIWMPGHVRVQALKLQTDVNPRTSPASASRHFWAVPWTLLAILLAGWLLRRLRRRTAPRHLRSSRSGPATPAAPEPDHVPT